MLGRCGYEAWFRLGRTQRLGPILTLVERHLSRPPRAARAVTAGVALAARRRQRGGVGGSAPVRTSARRAIR